MPSVTKRIKQIKQPRGGYVEPNSFNKIELNDGKTLKTENIHSSLVGLTVDYMTRFMLGNSKESAFSISLLGAKKVGEQKKAETILKKIKKLDKKSIYNACKLVGYDVCVRAGSMYYKNVDGIKADKATVENIKIMIDRSLEFFKQYGPVVKDGITFEGGYTDLVETGDADFITKDTLWDFKVSKSKINSYHTVQLLIYYIMGRHSIHKEFDNINNIGIFNPRLNVIYIKNIESIAQDTIEIIEKEVIGYDDKKNSKPISLFDILGDTFLEIEDAKLTIADIMKELSCSRYTVMKMYGQYGLPLQKNGNKYFIKESDFETWKIEYIKKQRNKRLLFYIFMIAYVLLLLCILFRAQFMYKLY